MSLESLVGGESIHNLLKGEDIPYVREVVEHFEKYGVHRIHLKGSALEGKNYNDVDLEIIGNSEKIKHALEELYRRFEFKDHSGHTIYEVEPSEDFMHVYVGRYIDERHKLKIFRGIGKPELILDLNFVYDPMGQPKQGFFYKIFEYVNSTLKNILKKN